MIDKGDKPLLIADESVIWCNQRSRPTRSAEDERFNKCSSFKGRCFVVDNVREPMADEARGCTSILEFDREYFRDERVFGIDGGGGGGGGRRVWIIEFDLVSVDNGTSCSIDGEGFGVRWIRGGIRGGTFWFKWDIPVLGVNEYGTKEGVSSDRLDITGREDEDGRGGGIKWDESKIRLLY